MEAKSDKATVIQSKEFWKKIFSITLRVFVSTVVLYFIISMVQWPKVLDAYDSADGRYIIAAGILLFANIGVRTLKWHIMLHSVKSSPTYTEAFGSVMLGISLGSFTPGEIGEFAGRALHISNAKRSHLVGLALLDKAQIFIVTGMAGSIAITFLTFHNYLLIALINAAIVSISFIFLLKFEILAKIGHHLNTSFFQKTWLTRVIDGFTLLNFWQLSTTVLYTIVFHGILVLQMFFLINAFSEITFVHAFIGTSAMMFVKSLFPISIGDLGIREAGSIFFFSTYNISQASALNASLLLFVINVLLPSIVGTYFLRFHKFSVNKLFEFIKKK